CSAALGSAPLWKQPLRSFAVLDASLSSKEAAYSEAAGAMYCFDLDGTRKWVLSSERDHHFLRVAWNESAGRWMAVDWNYGHGGPKRLLKISQAGAPAVVVNLGEPAETRFFARGDRLVTSNGEIFDVQSGQIIWNFLKD